VVGPCVPKKPFDAEGFPQKNLALGNPDNWICPISLDPFERPVLLQEGYSVNEAPLALWMDRQFFEVSGEYGTEDTYLTFDANAGYRSDLNLPIDLEKLALNWPLMWEMDQQTYEAFPLHRMAMHNDGLGLADHIKHLSVTMPKWEFEMELWDPQGPDEVTPLMLAAKWGQQAAAEALLAPKIPDYGAPVALTDVGDRHGATALWYACEAGHVDVARIILSAEREARMGNPNCVVTTVHHNRQGIEGFERNANTPLWVSIAQGNCEMVKLLVDHGALEKEDFSRDVSEDKFNAFAPTHPAGCTCRSLFSWDD
jgi:hypothetical protein